MVSIKYLEDAIKDIDAKVQTILFNTKLSLNEKDDLMLPLVRESKVIKQCLEDIYYLRDNPPTAKSGCKAGSFREEE